MTQKLSRADWRIPEEVKVWLDSVGTKEYRGLKTVGEWTYIYIKAVQNETLSSFSVLNDLNGTIIKYLVQPSANIRGSLKHEQLLRLPSRFMQFDKQVIW